MDSDGRPWRPFVHILDISRAIDCVLRAPRDVIHGEIFNVGSNAQNYQIRAGRRDHRRHLPGLPASSSATAPATTATTGPTSTRSTSGCPVRVPLRRGARRPAADRRLPGHRDDRPSCSSSAATPGSSRSSTCSRPARSTSGSSGSIRRAGGRDGRPRADAGHEARAGSSLEGSVPAATSTRIGDDRGFFARIWDEAVRRSSASRSGTSRPTCRRIAARGPSAGSTGRCRRSVSRSSSDANVARSSMSRSTCVRSRPRTASGRGTSWIPTRERWSSCPAGCAHGYQALEDDAEVSYQVSHPYVPGSERGIRWDDPTLRIAWPITDGVIVSDKDAAWPDLSLETHRYERPAACPRGSRRRRRSDPGRPGRRRLCRSRLRGQARPASPGIELVAIANRTIGEAERAYREAGVDAPGRVDSAAELMPRSEAIAPAITDDPTVLTDASRHRGDRRGHRRGRVRCRRRGPRDRGRQAPDPDQCRAGFVPRPDPQDARGCRPG